MKRPQHKQDKLFTQLLDIASNLEKGGSYFLSAMEKEEIDISAFQQGVSKIEQQGDDLVHKLITDLNNSFITPIEREDALQLAETMDEVLDGLEDIVVHFYMFGITKMEPSMIEMAGNISKGTEEIHKAMSLLAEKNLKSIKEHIIQISTYEGYNDHIVRRAVKEMFEAHKDDPIRLIQIYEIYKLLERTSNACHHVSKVLDTVVMKNA